jgi:kumamolisin
MSDSGFVPLPGSERPALPGRQPAGTVDPAAPIEVTLVLRRRAELPPDVLEGARTLSPQELADRYGADPGDVERVRSVLAEHRLEVVAADPPSRRVTVAGSAGRLADVFGASLTRVTSADPVTGGEVAHRHREGPLRIPAELDGIVVAVLGLDDRPQAATRFRVASPGASQVSYTPLELARIYELPSGVDGSGQTVAIVELGGGFAQGDLDAYFSALGLATPDVTAVGVDGAANQPGQDPNGADGEVLLDIEVAGALAPKATIPVYFAPNTDRGFLDAVSTAAHATPTPTAISISWGQSEDAWTAQARNAMSQAFADAAALGATVCVASGDSGSADGQSDGKPHVDFPAASPYALACGGTTLRADAATGAVTSETVWNDGSGGATGGGVSDAFALPSWQVRAGVPARAGGGSGRGVPDVSADADPATGYQVLVDGQRLVIGGTSAVAPLWAGLICLVAQSVGRRLGLVQPSLYAQAAPGSTAPAFRDITSGTNGAYDAGPGWDPCTGLGVPIGTRLAAALSTRGA